jgi:hypothetical protein
MENVIENWTAVKMSMSLILTPDPPEVELREKKPYSMKHRNAQIKKRTNSWRSPKKI